MFMEDLLLKYVALISVVFMLLIVGSALKHSRPEVSRISHSRGASAELEKGKANECESSCCSGLFLTGESRGKSP